MTAAAAAQAWTREALRLNARYVEEIVIGWGLCPWAAQAWRTGAVSRRVLLAPDADATAVLAFVDAIAGDPATSIGLLVWPRLSLDAAAFGAFAEQVRRAERARHQPPFLIAAFHPQLREEPPPDRASLVPFIRRTPDPTLQLVRARLLDALPDDVSPQIAGANFAAVQQRTAAALDQAVRSIHQDRAASYAGLLAASAVRG